MNFKLFILLVILITIAATSLILRDYLSSETRQQAVAIQAVAKRRLMTPYVFDDPSLDANDNQLTLAELEAVSQRIKEALSNISPPQDFKEVEF